MPPNGRGKFPWKWRWLGLLPLLALLIGGGIWAWRHMEGNMMERAVANLECEGVDVSGLDMDWSYRNVDVEGVIPAGFSAADIERIIDDGSDNAACLADKGVDNYDDVDDPGVRDVDIRAAAAPIPEPEPEPEPTAVPDPTVTPLPDPTATPEPEPTAVPTATPEPDPTATPVPQIAALAATADYDGLRITLSGEVASEAQRDSLVAAAIAQVGEDNVIDELTIADGDPSATADDRVAELATIISQYGGNILDGTASIDDDALTYQLRSPSDEAKAALELAGTGEVEVPSRPAAQEFTG